MVHALVNAELPPELMSISCARSPDQSAHSALPGALLLVTLEYCQAFIAAPKLAGILTVPVCLRFSCGSASFGLPQSS